MPKSKMLELTLAIHKSLALDLPALVDEINASEEKPEYQIAPPINIDLGIRTEMLKRPLKELPVIACGVYTRTPVEEGEQDFSVVDLEFVIDVYLGNKDATELFIQSHKWASVLDQWVERHCDALVFGFSCQEAPEIDISYVLELPREGTFRQLVTATGVFRGAE